MCVCVCMITGTYACINIYIPVRVACVHARTNGLAQCLFVRPINQQSAAAVLSRLCSDDFFRSKFTPPTSGGGQAA